MKRRDFLKTGPAALSVAPLLAGAAPADEPDEGRPGGKARIAVIGVGSRGTGLLRSLCRLPNAEVVAVCDLYRDRAEAAAKICADAGAPAPKVYAEDERAWREVYAREKPDAVIIATYWDSHAEMSAAALEAGIHVGCEVPIAMTVDDCWRLVETAERTGVPCMMLENWSFRRDNLALLNMIRLGMLGEMMHGHCAYSHYGVPGSYKADGRGDTWRNRYIAERGLNCNYYPTHALGPIVSWFDINAGDRFTEIYSAATAARGVNDFVRREFGPDHPNATRAFSQGDVVTSILKTANGKTIVVNLDTKLPRPYANRWLAAGTRGVYDEEKASIYLDGVSPAAEAWEPWAPYEEKYNHRFWSQGSTGGHMGTDPLMLRLFVDSVAARRPTPLDVHDSVVMSAVVDLSGRSIKENRPVEFPDFTRGAWKTRQPYFALDRRREG
ncbi:Gfo/Idh/MocA family oxidoreductase [Paludisphaera sp.]|uniref:Gfo/Idh/MocA family protein n=1 Tax=Paludisphaera sp. TaxID=2017432 RepID=UPI00301E2EA6